MVRLIIIIAALFYDLVYRPGTIEIFFKQQKSACRNQRVPRGGGYASPSPGKVFVLLMCVFSADTRPGRMVLPPKEDVKRVQGRGRSVVRRSKRGEFEFEFHHPQRCCVSMDPYQCNRSPDLLDARGT